MPAWVYDLRDSRETRVVSLGARGRGEKDVPRSELTLLLFQLGHLSDVPAPDEKRNRKQCTTQTSHLPHRHQRSNQENRERGKTYDNINRDRRIRASNRNFRLWTSSCTSLRGPGRGNGPYRLAIGSCCLFGQGGDC